MRLQEEFRARTKRYAAGIVRLYAGLPRNRKEVEVLGHQLLRLGTSVAAHVREASRARSAPEFSSKINGAIQEADESQLWIELLREECGICGTDMIALHRETDELLAILVTMSKNTRRDIK